MATLKFLLRNKRKNSNIYVRYSIERNKVLWRKTGYIIDSSVWDEVKERSKLKDEDSKNLNTNLRNLKTFLENAYNDGIRSGIEFTGDWLQLQIDIFNNKIQPVELDILETYIQKYVNRQQKVY